MLAWKITKDCMTVGSMGTVPNHTGTWGNENGVCLIRNGKVKGVTHKGESVCPATDEQLTVKFRITDDDGELYYEGQMTPELADSEQILRPIDDFATPNDGAPNLQILNKGVWEHV